RPRVARDTQRGTARTRVPHRRRPERTPTPARTNPIVDMAEKSAQQTRTSLAMKHTILTRRTPRLTGALAAAAAGALVLSACAGGAGGGSGSGSEGGSGEGYAFGASDEEIKAAFA